MNKRKSAYLPCWASTHLGYFLECPIKSWSRERQDGGGWRGRRCRNLDRLRISATDTAGPRQVPEALKAPGTMTRSRDARRHLAKPPLLKFGNNDSLTSQCGQSGHALLGGIILKTLCMTVVPSHIFSFTCWYWRRLPVSKFCFHFCQFLEICGNHFSLFSHSTEFKLVRPSTSKWRTSWRGEYYIYTLL